MSVEGERRKSRANGPAKQEDEGAGEMGDRALRNGGRKENGE